MSLRPITALVALLLSACAGLAQDPRGYPSLAKRSIETQDTEDVGPQETGATILSSTDDPALDGELAALTENARKGAAAFDRLYGEVAGRIRVSASAPVSSEQWVAAQVDLGRLEQARYDSVSALASLDTLYAVRMKDVADGKVVGGVAQIETVRGRALAIVDSQNDRVDALRFVLREP